MFNCSTSIESDTSLQVENAGRVDGCYQCAWGFGPVELICLVWHASTCGPEPFWVHIYPLDGTSKVVNQEISIII